MGTQILVRCPFVLTPTVHENYWLLRQLTTDKNSKFFNAFLCCPIMLLVFVAPPPHVFRFSRKIASFWNNTPKRVSWRMLGVRNAMEGGREYLCRGDSWKGINNGGHRKERKGRRKFHWIIEFDAWLLNYHHSTLVLSCQGREGK